MGRKIKRTLGILLSVVLLFSLCPNIMAYDTVSEGVFFLQTGSNSLALRDLDSYSVVLENFYDIVDQKWILIDVGSGYYQIKSFKSGNFLTAPKNATEGSSIELASKITDTENDTPYRQYWKFIETNTGVYKIQSGLNEDLVMGCSGIMTSYGYSFVLKTYTEKDGWELKKHKAFFLGIPDYSTEGHNHTTVLENLEITLKSQGEYSNMWTHSAYLNSHKETILDYMSYAEFFAYRGHGDYNITLGTTYIVLNNNSMDYNYSIYGNDIYRLKKVMVDMSNCKLALFPACYTAGYVKTVYDEEFDVDVFDGYVTIENCLPAAMISAGADVAIGFRNTINCNCANTWLEVFYENYSASIAEGNSTYAAAYKSHSIAIEECYDTHGQYASCLESVAFFFDTTAQ